jgi:hypothetical protein
MKMLQDKASIPILEGLCQEINLTIRSIREAISMAHNLDNEIVGKLIGLALISASHSGGTMNVLFEGGWELAIYNPFVIEKTGDRISVDEESYLVGKTVVDCASDSEEFILTLSGRINLRVDLSDEAFTGPEAMQLIGPSGEIVVWN